MHERNIDTDISRESHGEMPVRRVLATCKEEWVGADHQRTGPQLNQRRKDRIEIVIGAGMQDMRF